MSGRLIQSSNRFGEERIMPKKFYTEKEIEDMFKGGIMSLEVNDSVVLTELAYEKARSVGMKLVRDKPDNPPSAPVRPYISKISGRHGSAPVAAPAPVPVLAGPRAGKAEETDLPQRIREAVFARLGSEVDTSLLDVIIKRVLTSTGVK
jgi:hypothetical protein